VENRIVARLVEHAADLKMRHLVHLKACEVKGLDPSKDGNAWGLRAADANLAVVLAVGEISGEGTSIRACNKAKRLIQEELDKPYLKTLIEQEIKP
jgi:hypothetical protein